MGIAALVIGIVAVVVGFIPGCGLIALLPAIVGLILAIIDMKKKGKAGQPKGLAVAGLILNIVAIAIILIWTLLLASTASTMQEVADEMENQLRQPPAGASEPDQPPTPPDSPAE